jgi:hypothetical protein
VIHGLSHTSSTLAAIEPHGDYFASRAHYQSLARRIAAVLRSGGFVLVTGDPPADPQSLSQALRDVGGSSYAVIDIRCGPELTGTDLKHRAPVPAGLGASVDANAAVTPRHSATSSSLFLFNDFDLLSDRQIEEVCEATLDGDQVRASGVLLASLDFVARTERPPLQFLKRRLAAHLCVQDVGDDEVFPFFHNQLLAQRDRRSEARGFRRGIVMGLTASGVLAAAASGAFVFLQPTTDRVHDAPAHAEESRSMNERQLLLAPTNRAATSAVPVQAAPETETTDTSTPGLPSLSATMAVPTEVEISPAIAPSAPADPSSGPRLSEAEIDALRQHGDAFLGAGDITSARLYYERAAEAGDGNAALQLGASYDPVVLGRAGIRGVIGDPAKALSWYQRALELGMTAADQRIKSLVEEADTLSH